MSIVSTYTFECVPSVELENDYSRDVFASFLMDVPSVTDDESAARRAWWTAFHKLGRIGFEPEGFAVFEYHTTTGRGRPVDRAGFLVTA